MTTIVCWDLETTGRLRTSSNHWLGQPGIVQFGAQRIELMTDGCWLMTKELSLMLDPELPGESWESGAIEVTGIGPEQVAGAPTLMMAHAQIADLFLGAEFSMGYNLRHFDYPCLGYQLERYNLQHHFPWPPKDIDLMRYSSTWCDIAGKRGTKRPTLGELHEAVLGVPIEDAHDALNDVKACVSVFLAKGGLTGVGL